MIKTGAHIKFLFLLMIGLAVPTVVFGGNTQSPQPAANNTGNSTQGSTVQPQKCSKDCSMANSCILETDGSGHLKQLSSNSGTCSSCMAEEAKKGCFNTTPASCVGSYIGLGYRPNGAGGNPKPRNHLGNDLGAANCKDANTKKYVPLNVYAAADGVVKYAKTSGGGGRTVQIEHTKGCKNAAEPNYKSTYRHLLQIKVNVGDHVKKDAVIGIMGGSNAASIGATPCDNTAQAGWPGYTRAGCSSARPQGYDIHLHFEVENGKASGSSTQASARSAMTPDCDNLQVLCGGCPNNASKCRNVKKKCETYKDGTVGDVTGGYVDVNNGAGGASGSTAKDAQCTKEYLDADQCVFCPLFRAIFNTASSIAKDANDALAGPSKLLVSIGFLIWIAFYLLKQMASTSGTSTGEMLKGLVYQGFRVAVITIILSDAIYATMDLTLNPVMETGLNFVQLLNGDESCITSDADFLKDLRGYDSAKGYDSDSANGGLSLTLGKSILCSIKSLETATGYMMGLGNYSICISSEHKFLAIIPHLVYFTSGLLFWLAGLALLLLFPWCLIDCMLQMCIAAAMVPCALAAFAFKVTSKYIKIIWNFFINAMFNFVFMAIIIYIINSNLKQWLGIPEGDFAKESFLTGIQDESGPPALAFWGLAPIKCLCTCFLCWTFFDEAKSMAEKFADSPGLGGNNGIGRMVGGTLASAAQNYGAKPALALGGKAASAAGSFVNSRAGNKLRSWKNAAKGGIGWAGAKLMKPFGGQSSLIKDDKGKVVGFQSSMNILGMRFERKVTKDASGVYTQTKDVHRSNSAERAFEKKYDANGNVAKIALRDENGNIMKDKDGNDMMVDAYVSKHRTLGVTHGREDMQAYMINGKLVYRTADDKRQFTMNKAGNIDTYKTQRLGAIGMLGSSQGKATQHGGTRTVDDGFTKTRTAYNSLGNATQQTTTFKNETAKYLVNKDGTINTYAMMQMRNGAADKDAADRAILSQVLAKRGITLPNEFDKQNIVRNEDGSITLRQINKDSGRSGANGEEVIINAKMVNDVMVTDIRVTDKNGSITHIVNNGIQSKTETFTLDKNNQYQRNCQHGFADHVHAQNSHKPPLDRNGNWGNNIDRDKAMIGFTDADFSEHVQEIDNRHEYAQQMENAPHLSAAEVQNLLKANVADIGMPDVEIVYASKTRVHQQLSAHGIGTSVSQQHRVNPTTPRPKQQQTHTAQSAPHGQQRAVPPIPHTQQQPLDTTEQKTQRDETKPNEKQTSAPENRSEKPSKETSYNSDKNENKGKDSLNDYSDSSFESSDMNRSELRDYHEQQERENRLKEKTEQEAKEKAEKEEREEQEAKEKAELEAKRQKDNLNS